MSRVQISSRAVLVFSLIGVLSGYASAAKRLDNQGNKDEFNQSRMDARHDAGMQMNADLQRASHMIGKKVKSEDGKTLGRIYDVVLTPDLSSVSYVAVSRGGAFGFNRELYAVPWSAFRTGARNTYYLPVSANQFKAMTGFKERYWPAGPSAGWVATTANTSTPTFSGTTRELNRDIQARRVSQVIGRVVRDDQGKRTGTIRDVIIVRDTGQIRYTIVSNGGVFGIGTRFAAVPPIAIRLQPRGYARLSVGRNMLAANSFSPMRWPDLSSPSFEQRVAQLFGTQPGGAALGYVPPQGNVTAEPEANAPSPAPQETPMGGREHQVPGSVNFSPSELKTIEGTIVHVGRLGPGTTGTGMLALRLKTADAKIIRVDLGPRDYISQRGFSLMKGDHIAVTGANARVGWRHMFVATEVARDGQILKLRDARGHALWPESTSSEMNTRSGVATNGEPSPDNDWQNPLLDW